MSTAPVPTPGKKSNPLGWILGLGAAAVALLVVSGLLIASFFVKGIRVRENAKQVEINTSAGQLTLGNVPAERLGLPIYPGATRVESGGGVELTTPGDERMAVVVRITPAPIRWRRWKPGTASAWGRNFGARGPVPSGARSTHPASPSASKTSPLSPTRTTSRAWWLSRSKPAGSRSHWFAPVSGRLSSGIPGLPTGVQAGMQSKKEGGSAAPKTLELPERSRRLRTRAGLRPLAMSRDSGMARAPPQGRNPRRLRRRTHLAVTAGHVVADGLQPLQDRLPLLPVELSQERPQTLDERILQESLAV